MNREFQITITIKSDTIQQAKEEIKEKFKNVSEIKCLEKRRSSLQNNALWLWLTQLAKALNKKNFDMRTIISQDVEIAWSKDSLMEYVFRPLMKARFNKKSTTQLSRSKEIDELIDIIVKIISERTNGEVEIPPWPCLDNMLDIDYN